MEFKETKFDITNDISLIVSLAYVQGHPIVETKKTKINYKSTLIEVNRENKNNEVMSERLLKKSLRSIFSIELVNYLNRLINGDNLYEVYVNNSNKIDKPEELIDYVFKPEKQWGGAAPLDIGSKYIDDLMNNHGDVDLDLLDQNRNPKYPTCVHNFEEIDYVPVYTYIHPTLAKNRGETIHIMHLGLLFQLLTRIKGLPEFNTQASMSALNSVLASEHSGISLETENKSNYEAMVAKKNKYKHKFTEEKRMHEETKTLLKDAIEKISEQTNTINEQRQQIAYQTSLILQQSGNLDEAREDIRDLLDLNYENSRNLNDLMQASKVMKNELKKHNASNTSTETHKPQLVLFLSASIPGGKYKKDQPEHSIWIGTKCQEFERGIEHYLPDDAEILFQSEVVGIDIIKFILDSTADIYIDSFYRQILLQDVNVEEFINRVNNIVIERGNHDAIINLKPITDRIKAREVQQQINDRRQSRKEHAREVKQNIINNGNLFIFMYGEYQRLYVKNENNELTKELDPSKIFYIRRIVNGQRQHERLSIRTLENSQFQNHS